MNAPGDLKMIGDWLSQIARSGDLGDEHDRRRITANVLAIKLHDIADDMVRAARPVSAREREGQSWWRRAWRAVRPRRVAF